MSNALPENLNLLVHIQEFTINRQIPPRNTVPLNGHQYRLPRCTEEVDLSEDDYNAWMTWSRQGLHPATNDQFTLLESTSIFEPEPEQGYLLVPYNCALESVDVKAREEPTNEWTNLRFHNHRTTNCCTSVADYCAADDKIGGPAPPAIMPQFIPDKYQCEEEYVSWKYCKLGGRISILLGLIAMSTSRQHVWDAIQTCFNVQNSSIFCRHDFDHGQRPKHYGRGMIIEIGYDRRHVAPDQLETMLKKLENWHLFRDLSPS